MQFDLVTLENGIKINLVSDLWAREHMSWRVCEDNAIFSILSSLFTTALLILLSWLLEEGLTDSALQLILRRAVETIPSESFCHYSKSSIAVLHKAAFSLHFAVHLKYCQPEASCKNPCNGLRAFQNYVCKNRRYNKYLSSVKFALSILNALTRATSSLLVWHFCKLFFLLISSDQWEAMTVTATVRQSAYIVSLTKYNCLNY